MTFETWRNGLRTRGRLMNGVRLVKDFGVVDSERAKRVQRELRTRDLTAEEVGQMLRSPGRLHEHYA